MDQPEDYLAAGSSATAVEWLSPGAALACFEPPEGLHLEVAGQVREEVRARYGFRIGDLGLLINPDIGNEVLTVSSITPLPDAPPGFLGLINLRGNLVPLYELRVRLGMDTRQARTETLALVFGEGEEAVGVVIESFPAVLPSLRPSPDLPPLPDALQNHVSAGYLQDGMVWLEFDHGSFFDEACRVSG
jgi:chemotaxis signal transduction protein